jgi:hypothetical protein
MTEPVKLPDGTPVPDRWQGEYRKAVESFPREYESALLLRLFEDVAHLEAQLQGATANEQSVVNEEAQDRDELALVVQQKDALSVANETQRKALHLAQSELDYQYQTLCSSVCPPCKQGELYDYSELRPEERAEIDRVETALDAVDAALAETGD